MTKAQQYDLSIDEIADRFDASAAIGQVLHDLKLLRQSINLAIDKEALEDLIQHVEERVRHDKPFEYILGQIPDDIKGIITIGG